MRIVHVVPTYLPAARYGGTIYAVHGLCKALVNRGHDVEVLTTDVDGDGSSGVDLDRPVDLDGVKVRYFPVPGWRRLYRSPALGAHLRAHAGEADVLHLHSVFLWPTLAAARAAQRAGRPYVVSPHGMLDPALLAARGYWRKWIWIACFERRTLEHAARIHVTSALEAGALKALGLDLAPLEQVPNGIEWTGAGPAEAPRGQHVLFLGRLNWKKGLDVLLEALARAPGIEALVVGPDDAGYLDSMRALSTRLGLGARVEFRPPVEPAERDRLLRGAAVLVLPSRSENFALVVAEAMAQACPVIVSDAVGLAADVRESGAGIVCAAEPRALAAALGSIVGDPGRAAAMGAAGQRLARERFDWAAVAERMEGVYQRVARAPGIMAGAARGGGARC